VRSPLSEVNSISPFYRFRGGNSLCVFFVKVGVMLQVPPMIPRAFQYPTPPPPPRPTPTPIWTDLTVHCPYYPVPSRASHSGRCPPHVHSNPDPRGRVPARPAKRPEGEGSRPSLRLENVKFFWRIHHNKTRVPPSPGRVRKFRNPPLSESFYFLSFAQLFVVVFLGQALSERRTRFLCF